MNSLKSQMTLGHCFLLSMTYEVLSQFSNLDSCDKRFSVSLGKSQGSLLLTMCGEHRYQQQLQF